MASAETVRDYIRSNWERSFYRDRDGSGFDGMDLPFPYTSPCIRGEGAFSFFFYWDTCFTNLGLLRDGHQAMARDNIRNIVWFIQRQGYMPNHTAIVNRSQPPYLSTMVSDYLAATGDRSELASWAAALRQEYHFWTTARLSPCGLQRHGHHDTASGCAAFYRHAMAGRLDLPLEIPLAEQAAHGGHGLAEAETGWDFTPRFDRRCLDHAAVDLNGLLYHSEILLGDLGPELGWDDQALWQQRAGQRQALVTELLWDQQQGWFYDYDWSRGRRSPLRSLAGVLPLVSGLASAEQAARVAAGLSTLERTHGVAVTEESPLCQGYQWAFPNVWPPLVYATVAGLRRYGHDRAARRVAETFIATTVRLFAQTGQLWEKTDALSGEVASGEYDAAPMMGWTAGIFVALHDWLDGRD